MTDLKTYDHAENVISPDDLKLSEQHGADRLNTQAEIAEGRVKEISNSNRRATGPGAGGLDQFFEDFEHHTWTEKMPWELAEQVSTRVMNIVGQSATEYQGSLNGSSAATLEQQMLKYTQDDVLAKIQNIRAIGVHSLQTLETLKGFTATAQAEAHTQRADMMAKQQEAITNRNWWSRVGHKALTIGTLGAYKLVETEKRQKWFNSALEKSMNKQFDTINKNITTLEKQAGKNIAPMQSRIRRTLASEVDPAKKAAHKDELMAALRYKGADVSGINLTLWEITEDQAKIDFLEAAQGLDFVKKDLGVIGVSRSKEKQQTEMIESAQEQQDIVKISNGFKFKEIKEKSEFQKLPMDGVSVPATSDLVRILENELASSENLELLYAADINKADLLTDSVKLILLVKRINKGAFDIDKKLQVSTRQSLLAWILDMEKQTGDEKESHDDKEVRDQLDVLKDSTGAGQIKEVTDLMVRAKGLDITVGFGAFLTDITATSKIIQDKYQEFLDKKGDDNFPSKDFELIQKRWEPVLKSRKFLLEHVSQWTKDKEQYDIVADKLSNKKGTELKLLNNKIEELGHPKRGSIKKTFDAYKYLAGKIPKDMADQRSLKDKMEGYMEIMKTLKSDLNDLEGKREKLKKSEFPEFSDISKIQDHLDSLSVESGMDYTKRITKNKSFGSANLNERIQQKLRAETFADELDKKFIEQLEKNDQFDQLKNVSKGTKVNITYKKTAASSLRFPDQLGNTDDDDFIVVESNDKGVLLEKVGGGKSMTILGAAAKGGVAYKNAKIATTSGARDLTDPTVSGAWDSAIALNYKIFA